MSATVAECRVKVGAHTVCCRGTHRCVEHHEELRLPWRRHTQTDQGWWAPHEDMCVSLRFDAVHREAWMWQVENGEGRILAQGQSSAAVGGFDLAKQAAERAVWRISHGV